ncbi:MAG: hypothetical protein ACT4QC_06485 [Planctomycetaceae bacterium]
MDRNVWRGKRTAVGLCALACLGAALGLWVFSERPETNQLLSALSRVGLVTAAVWLAWPREGETIVWERLLPVAAGIVILAAIAPRLLPYALPLAAAVAIVAFFLRPRSRTRR